MPETINYQGFLSMLDKAVAQIEENHPYLSKLDSYGGDGDHGTTILRAMKKLKEAVDDNTDEDIGALTASIGWAVMGVDGGATGPLLGGFFQGMSDAAAGKAQLTGQDLAAMFEGGLKTVQQYSKARVGDKTLMDALIPAVDTLKAAAVETADIAAAFAKSAEAAEAGAVSTKALQARFGRSKNAGERSIGHQDAGATSMALIFKGFYEGVE